MAKAQTEKMLSLDAAIEGMWNFKSVLESESQAFGEATRLEIESLKSHVKQLMEVTTQGEGTVHKIERAVRAAERAQSTLAADHATVIDQLNQRVPKIEFELESLKETIASVDARF